MEENKSVNKDYNKNKHCRICNKPITNKSQVCRQCSNKYLPHCYKDGRTLKILYCCDCGAKITLYTAKRCKKCASSKKVIEGKIGYHGKHITYRGSCLKSGWEEAYAKYLDKNNVKWEYESKTFDLGNTAYTPDFYLPDTNEYIEIKGWWRKDAETKFNLFAYQYPTINMQVLTKMELRNMGVL